MKKFTLVAIFMALSNAIVADEIDNTIDFKSITPTQTPQSITQDADNLYQGIQPNPPQNATQNSQPIFTQAGYKSTKKGSFESEFGIGYIMSQFKAEQDWGGSKEVTQPQDTEQTCFSAVATMLARAGVWCLV